MKLAKNLSLIAGAIAITLSVSPFAVLADNSEPSTPVQSSAPIKSPAATLPSAAAKSSTPAKSSTAVKSSSVHQPTDAQTRNRNAWESLNLTNAQKTKIQEIRVSTHDQFMKILTPDQQAKWKAEHQGGKSQRMAHLSDLNLTEKQKTQVSELRKTQRSQMEAVLTPDQLTKLKQYRQSHPHGDTRPDTIQ